MFGFIMDLLEVPVGKTVPCESNLGFPGRLEIEHDLV